VLDRCHVRAFVYTSSALKRLIMQLSVCTVFCAFNCVLGYDIRNALWLDCSQEQLLIAAAICMTSWSLCACR